MESMKYIIIIERNIFLKHREVRFSGHLEKPIRTGKCIEVIGPCILECIRDIVWHSTNYRAT